jgi:hypothetical protein
MERNLSLEELEARIAIYLLQLHEGDRLKTVKELAKTYNMSIGAISNATNNLEQAGAVSVDKRGHLGSFLKERSIGKLWSAAEHQPIVVSFPLIANPCLEGLATGLKQKISDAGIDTYLTFIRGSRTRLQALRDNKCHISVMSEFAALELCGEKEAIPIKFPPQSYVTSHEVFYRSDQPDDATPLRVAMDRSSFDIEGLTELEFAGADIEFVPVSFMQLPRVLKQGYADAGIWSSDDMQPHLDDQITHCPLSNEVQERIDNADTSAVLVTQAGSATVRSVVETVIDIDEILEIQRQVLEGKRVPEY